MGRRLPRRRVLQLGLAGLAGLALGCSRRDDEALPGALPSAPNPGALPPTPPRVTHPLVTLLEDLLPSAQALVASPDPDEQAWLQLARTHLERLPRLQAEQFLGPSRVRFGDDRGRGPLSVRQVRIDDGGSLPPHDHRDLCGVLLGLSGRLVLRRYESLAPALLGTAAPGATFEVRQTGEDMLMPGKTFTYTRTRDNIHALSGEGSGGEYLDLQLRFSDLGGSWVLHIDDQPLSPGGKLYRARWVR